MLRQGWGGEGLERRYVQAGERFGGQVLCIFFGHLPAEIFKAISLCSFCRGCLKENDLSTVTGRGVDRIYIYTYIYLLHPSIFPSIYVYMDDMCNLHPTSFI